MKSLLLLLVILSQVFLKRMLNKRNNKHFHINLYDNGSSSLPGVSANEVYNSNYITKNGNLYANITPPMSQHDKDSHHYYSFPSGNNGWQKLQVEWKNK
jgi:hypothetical protein